MHFRSSVELICCFAAFWLAAAWCCNAAEKDTSIEGVWSKRSDFCSAQLVTSNNLTISENEMHWFEDGCDFTGGLKESPSKWIMKGRCCGANCENRESLPETQIDLQVEGGILKVVIHGDNSEPYYYAVKCYAAPRTPTSPERTFWNHNGSTMYLVATGNRRQFFYQDPRPAMRAAGAQQDSLLFEGQAAGTRYIGRAYIFDRQCGQFPYPVEGPILEGGRKVMLFGHAPRVNGECRIVGTLPDTLVFQLDPRQ